MLFYSFIHIKKNKKEKKDRIIFKKKKDYTSFNKKV